MLFGRTRLGTSNKAIEQSTMHNMRNEIMPDGCDGGHTEPLHQSAGSPVISGLGMP